MTTRRFYRSLLLWTEIFILGGFNPLLQAGARHPKVKAPDATVESVSWVRDDVTDQFDSRIYKGEHYLSIEQLAKMSNSQLRWQSVTEQACLSRNTGLVCFNWERAQIYMNGEILRGPASLRFEDGHLFIPMRFVTSKAFSSFSGNEFYWNVQARRLTQEEPVTVSIPPVENMGDRYQLALPVKKSVPYHLLQNSKDQIWIRFVRGHTDGSQILEGDSVIKEIRVDQKRHSADLIVKLGPAALSHEVYFDQGTKKLTIDVFKEESTQSGSSFPETPKGKMAAPVEATAPLVIAPKKTHYVPEPSTDPKIWTVVVDAGHGGMDPGAIGTRGTFEKDVNLKVAKELAQALHKNKNYRVILTRDKDEFLTLAERTDIANRAKADVFVSIHCNSSISVKSDGFEVYILSPEATDQAADAVARLENSVVSLEIKKGTSKSRLNELLASMAVYDFINESSKFASYVCRGIKKKSSIDKTSVKEANFHVLRGAQMPSVLIELGYLSHPYSELQLRSSRYKQQLANGVADGVAMYQQSLGHKKQSITNQFEKPYKKAQK